MGPSEEETPHALKVKDHTPGGRSPPGLLPPLCTQRAFPPDRERQETPIAGEGAGGRQRQRKDERILAADAAPQSHPPGLSSVLMLDKTTHGKGWKGSQNPLLLQLGYPHRKGEAPTGRGCTKGLHGTHGPSFPGMPCDLALELLPGEPWPAERCFSLQVILSYWRVGGARGGGWGLARGEQPKRDQAFAHLYRLLKNKE